MNAPLVPTTRCSWMQSHASMLSLLVCAFFPVASSAQHSTTARDQVAPASPYVAAGQISEYVREVFQDRDGVYWFGTNGDGVCRYDGTSLTYLSVEEGFGGVCRFDGESFVPFPLPRVEVENPPSRFSPKVVFAMFQDQAGNLWFGTDGEGAHKYDGKSFTTYTTKDGLAGNLVRSLCGDRRGRIWIGTDGGGVSCFDGSVFRTFTTKDGLNNDRIFEILQDSAGNMWFSTLGAGTCRYDGTSFTAFREDYDLMINGRPARGHVQEFFEDKDGVLWLGCSGGLFRLDGESFINVTQNGPWPNSPSRPAPRVK